MPIPILSDFANFSLSTRILFVQETRFCIVSFPESPLRDEIENLVYFPAQTGCKLMVDAVEDIELLCKVEKVPIYIDRNK